MSSFARYIGIDYSGAETPTASLKALRVYVATRSSPPEEVPPQSTHVGIPWRRYLRRRLGDPVQVHDRVVAP